MIEWGILQPISGHELCGQIESVDDEYIINIPTIGEITGFTLRVPKCSTIWIMPTTEEIILEKLKSSYALRKFLERSFLY